jgi:hypothetical protein
MWSWSDAAPQSVLFLGKVNDAEDRPLSAANVMG